MNTQEQTTPAAQAQLTAKLLSPQEFGTLGWVIPDPNTALQELSYVPIGGLEAMHAAAAVPLVFRREAAGKVHLGALLGPPGRAIWQVDTLPYAPFAVRYFPFTVQRVIDGPDGTPDWRLACYQGEDWLRPDGTMFFEPDGGLTPQTQNVAKAFQSACRDFERGLEQAQALETAGLLKPLSRRQTHLFGMNQAALAALDATQLSALHASGALRLAHAQIVSQSHLSRLDLTRPPLSQTNQAAATAPHPQTAPMDGPDGFLDAILEDIEADLDAPLE